MSGADIAVRFQELDRETVQKIQAVYVAREQQAIALQALCAKTGHSMTRSDTYAPDGDRKCVYCRAELPRAYVDTEPARLHG